MMDYAIYILYKQLYDKVLEGKAGKSRKYHIQGVITALDKALNDVTTLRGDYVIIFADSDR
jgi:hypothetical protein